MVEENTAATRVASYPRLLIDGQEHPELMQALQALEVRLEMNQPARGWLRLLNWGNRQPGAEAGYLFADDQLLDHGKTLEIYAGAGEGAQRIFEGEIFRLEGVYPLGAPPELELVAFDRLAQMGQARHSRSFTQVTDRHLVEQLAQEYGLQTQILLTHSEAAYDSVVQIEQTDLELLQQRVRSQDLLLWVADGVLHLQPWLSTAGELVALVQGRQLLAARLAADLSGQASQLDLPGWNPQNKHELLGQADNASLSGELGGLESGPQVVERVFGEWRDQHLHGRPADAGQADRLAEVTFRQRSREFGRGAVLAVVQPRLRPGSRVALAGLGERFDGNYRVESVRHRFDRHGFHSMLQVSRSGQSQEKTDKRPDRTQNKKQTPIIRRPADDAETAEAKNRPGQQTGGAR